MARHAYLQPEVRSARFAIIVLWCTIVCTGAGSLFLVMIVLGDGYRGNGASRDIFQVVPRGEGYIVHYELTDGPLDPACTIVAQAGLKNGYRGLGRFRRTERVSRQLDMFYLRNGIEPEPIQNAILDRMEDLGGAMPVRVDVHALRDGGYSVRTTHSPLGWALEIGASLGALAVSAVLIWTFHGSIRLLRRAQAAQLNRCVHCRYDLTGLTSEVCPECGGRIA